MRTVNNYRNRSRRRRSSDDVYSSQDLNGRNQNYGGRYERSSRFTDHDFADTFPEDREYRGYGRNYGGRYDNRNMFERAGDKIRDTWNDWTDSNDDRTYNSRVKRGGYNNNADVYSTEYSNERRNKNRGRGRNIFERAGSAVRETWNDITDRDERRGYGQGRQPYRYESDVYSWDERNEYPSRRQNTRGRTRNMMNRTGNRIREAWDDLTENNSRRNYSDRNRDTYHLDDSDYRYGRNKRIADMWI